MWSSLGLMLGVCEQEGALTCWEGVREFGTLSPAGWGRYPRGTRWCLRLWPGLGPGGLLRGCTVTGSVVLDEGL